MTHFSAVERTLASWSSSKNLSCYHPGVHFSSLSELTALGNGSSQLGGKLQPAFLPQSRQLLPSRAGLDGPDA